MSLVGPQRMRSSVTKHTSWGLREESSSGSQAENRSDVKQLKRHETETYLYQHEYFQTG